MLCVCVVVFSKENLKKLRDSITRRHKEREKTGTNLGNLYFGSKCIYLGYIYLNNGVILF